MPRANQRSKKQQDIKVVNDQFDFITNSLMGMAENCERLMPLVSDSLKFTVKLVRLYKEAFNKGLAKR